MFSYPKIGLLKFVPRLLIFILIVLFVGNAVVGQETTPEVESTNTLLSLPEQGELYKPMTFPMAVDPAIYNNPFDANDIELLGIFRSPSGEESVFPGFWMQAYVDRCPSCEVHDFQPEGEPAWQVRFTPREAGEWSYILQVRDNGAQVATHNGHFEVIPSDRSGFITVGANRRYFQYDNGLSYFPIGHNLKWSWDGGGGLRTYQRWLRELSEAGGNYARLFIDVPWFIGLEWTVPAGDYRAAQQKAAELDAILDTAAEYGIALQVVVLWHQALRVYNGVPVLIPENPPRPNVSPDWDNNPYNIVNGGLLSGTAAFFTNQEAQTLFKRRLRYIAARWGYSPQIFAWEIIDEIDRVSTNDTQARNNWLNSMVSYMRQIDQHGHLITAGSENFDPAVVANPLLDFTTSEFYQRRPIEEAGDQTTGVVSILRRQLQLNDSPALITDFSINPWFEPTADDPQGIHVQTSLWAAALSGSAGGAMGDYWDTYIIPQNLTRYYPPLAAFTAGVDWANLNLRPAEAGLLANGAAAYTPVRLSSFNRQFASRLENVVTRDITPDGIFPELSTVPSFLYGQVYNAQFSQVQHYTVAPPVDTYLEVGVRSVSSQAGARLLISVDNQNVAELDLAANSRATAVRVPLKAGEHRIALDNIGDDWLEIDYIEVGQLIAPARMLTLRDSNAGVALAWIQHRDYTWQNVAAGAAIEPITFQYRLGAMPAGRYVAEIWDPIAGGVMGEELLRVADDGILQLSLLPLNSQMAIRLFRQGEAPETNVTPAFTPTPAPTETAAPTSTPAPVQTNTPRPTEGPIP